MLLIGAIACVLLAPTSGIAQDRPTAAVDPDESEEIVVQATRNGRRVQDEPIRVEVLDREEVEEKILMRPGNIAMMVNETPGLRVQVTSPAFGAANVRVQGLKGRYTQILADGLPLYGGQTPALGLLQIAPTDLGQVEIIKGARRRSTAHPRWVALSISFRAGHRSSSRGSCWSTRPAGAART